MGNCFVRTGQFQDAIQAFEAIMEESPDHRSGIKLYLELLLTYMFRVEPSIMLLYPW